MKRHATDLLSFIPGVLAVGVAVLALTGVLTLDLLATDWVWPAILIGLGLVVLASAGIGRREPPLADEQTGGDPAVEDPTVVDAGDAVGPAVDTHDRPSTG